MKKLVIVGVILGSLVLGGCSNNEKIEVSKIESIIKEQVETQIFAGVNEINNGEIGEIDGEKNIEKEDILNRNNLAIENGSKNMSDINNNLVYNNTDYGFTINFTSWLDGYKSLEVNNSGSTTIFFGTKDINLGTGEGKKCIFAIQILTNEDSKNFDLNTLGPKLEGRGKHNNKYHIFADICHENPEKEKVLNTLEVFDI